MNTKMIRSVLPFFLAAAVFMAGPLPAQEAKPDKGAVKEDIRDRVKREEGKIKGTDKAKPADKPVKKEDKTPDRNGKKKEPVAPKEDKPGKDKNGKKAEVKKKTDSGSKAKKKSGKRKARKKASKKKAAGEQKPLKPAEKDVPPPAGPKDKPGAEDVKPAEKILPPPIEEKKPEPEMIPFKREHSWIYINPGSPEERKHLREWTWLKVYTEEEISSWGRSVGLTLYPDAEPIIDGRARFVSKFGSKVIVTGLESQRKYALWIDFVHFTKYHPGEILARLDIYVDGQLLKVLSFGDITHKKNPYRLPLPYDLTVDGKVEILFKEYSNTGGYWGIWDMVITDAGYLAGPVKKGDVREGDKDSMKIRERIVEEKKELKKERPPKKKKKRIHKKKAVPGDGTKKEDLDLEEYVEKNGEEAPGKKETLPTDKAKDKIKDKIKEKTGKAEEKKDDGAKKPEGDKKPVREELKKKAGKSDKKESRDIPGKKGNGKGKKADGPEDDEI